jgi:hypothetical protein
LGRLGNTCITTLKLIDIETGETLVSTKTELSGTGTISTELQALTDEIARKIFIQ